MKKFFTAMSVIGSILSVVNTGLIYPETAKVIAINDSMVTVECFNGNRFAFRDESEDWYIGDIASMLMYTNGTDESVYDDAVLMAKYSGYVED